MKNISTKEWWIGLIVALVALAIASVFEPALKDGILKEIRTYQQALRVDNDPKTYVYAKTTNVGNVLAYGNITASEPAFIPELKQRYGAILKVKEHYTMHTREVCSSRDKKGDCKSYTTETYYEWDTVGSQRFISGEWVFLDVTYQSNQLSMTDGNVLALDAGSVNASYAGYYDGVNLYEQSFLGMPSGNDRYYFRVVPISFACTIFSKFVGDTISDPVTGSQAVHVWDGTTPEQIIKSKKDSLIIFDVAYFLIWVLVCVGIWYWVSYDILDIQ